MYFFHESEPERMIGENVAIPQSEISMSIVTEQTRRFYQYSDSQQPRRLFRWPWHGPSTQPQDTLLEPVERKGLCGRHVNVEPVMLLCCIAFGITVSINGPFLIWARCVELYDRIKDNDSTDATQFCLKINDQRHKRQLDFVEADVAQMSIYFSLCSTIPCLITAPIFGAWSDYHGRRSPFLLSQLGSLIYFSLNSVSSLFSYSLSIYYFLVPAQLTIGLLPGVFIFTLSITIVIDECQDVLTQSRSGVPLRIALVCASQFAGLFLGSCIPTLLLSLSPASRHPDCFTFSWFLSTAFVLLAFLYTIFFVRETHFPAQTGDAALPFSTHIRHYTTDAFAVIVKKRDGWARLCLFLTVSFMFLEFLVLDGESLLFLVLEQYSWTDSQYSLLMLLRGLFNSIGTILLPLLFRFLPFVGTESLLVIVGICASGLNCLLLAFLHTPVQLFSFSLLWLLSAGISPGFRTILARLVPKGETGRLFALVSLVSILSPLVSKSVCYPVYRATMKQWPGLIFLLIAAVHVLILAGQIIVHLLMLPHWRSGDSQNLLLQHDEHSSSSSLAESDRSLLGSIEDEEGQNIIER